MEVQPVRTARFSGNILGFQMSTETPLNNATGMAAGKRQHSPISITRSLDANSAALFQMAVTNETLKTVTIKVGGLTVILTNALIVKEELMAGTFNGPSSPAPMEMVQFTYQSMEVQTNGSRITAHDSWTQ